MGHFREETLPAGCGWQELQGTPGFLGGSQSLVRVLGVMFEEFGLRYVGPIDGYDMSALLAALEVAKNYDRPMLLHITTKKGKGYAPAETSPEKWHGTTGFDVKSGATAVSSAAS